MPYARCSWHFGKTPCEFDTNPEFTADGGALYFIATPDGVPNIYRADLPGSVTRVTNVLSGISGITPLTPALSVASAAPGLVFSVYEDSHYNLYSVETPRPGVVREPIADLNAAVLPPLPRVPSEVARLLELDYVRPFDRPGKGWLWQFTITPGW